jgi:hypothetical protein
MYYTLETLLNHVFEDLQKPKAPTDIYMNVYVYYKCTYIFQYLYIIYTYMYMYVYKYNYIYV